MKPIVREPAVYDINSHVLARFAAVAADVSVDAELRAALQNDFTYITPIDESPGDGSEFIVYQVGTGARPNQPWLRKDDITYLIVTKRARIGGMVTELLIDILGQEDESWHDETGARYSMGTNYVFHNGVLLSSDSIPRDEEDGTYKFVVKFSILYSPNYTA